MRRRRWQLRLLPTDLILHIFSLLPLQEQRTARLVCREWNRLLTTYFRPVGIRLSIVIRGNGGVTMFAMDKEVEKEDLQAVPKYVEVNLIRFVGLADDSNQESIDFVRSVVDLDVCRNLQNFTAIHPPIRTFDLLDHPVIRRTASLTLNKDHMSTSMISKLEKCLTPTTSIRSLILTGFLGDHFDRIFTMIARSTSISFFRLEATWFNSCTSEQLIRFLRKINKNPRPLEGHFENYINDVDFHLVAQDLTMANCEGRYVYLLSDLPSKEPNFVVSFFGKTRMSISRVETSTDFKKYFVERFVRDELICQRAYVGKRISLRSCGMKRENGFLNVSVEMDCTIPGWAKYHVEKNGIDFREVERRVSQRIKDRFHHSVAISLDPLWNTEPSLLSEPLEKLWGRLCPRPLKVNVDWEMYVIGPHGFCSSSKSKRRNVFRRTFRSLRSFRARRRQD
ncbi:hypothetical protein QR680_017859 [Steinernema hermaphroditum]|uniref:F-box domain-containing protein n=1 Tax=Steinernema hermaphroditum TaxID=289476 RepID=A0AA39LPV8_9BILA|nr:hypothetical protein QR680_017859 [Steinernema hermaphroditum]